MHATMQQLALAAQFAAESDPAQQTSFPDLDAFAAFSTAEEGSVSEPFDAKAWEKEALAIWAAKEAESKTPQSHWKSLIVVNFPSFAEDDWLFDTFVDMGFDIHSVIGKSSGKGTKLKDGSTLYAFVNCKTPASAQMMKQACDEGRIEITEDSGKKWTLKADWAVQGGHGRDGGKRLGKEEKRAPKPKEGTSSDKANVKSSDTMEVEVDSTAKPNREKKRGKKKAREPVASSDTDLQDFI